MKDNPLLKNAEQLAVDIEYLCKNSEEKYCLTSPGDGCTTGIQITEKVTGIINVLLAILREIQRNTYHFLARRKILCKRFSTKTRISQEQLSSRLPWPLNDRLSGRLAGMRAAGGVNAGQAAVKY